MTFDLSALTPNCRQHNTRRFATAAFFLIVQLAACDAKGLSRSKAEDLLRAHPDVATVATHVKLPTSATQMGVSIDLWDSFQQLTPTGEKLFVKLANQAELRSPLQYDVSVTGIAPVSNKENEMEVQFTWHYVKPELSLMSVISSGGYGVALARRYDDGWRLDAVDITPGDTTTALSAADNAELAELQARALADRRDRFQKREAMYLHCTAVSGGRAFTGVKAVRPASWPERPATGVGIAMAGVEVSGMALNVFPGYLGEKITIGSMPFPFAKMQGQPSLFQSTVRFFAAGDNAIIFESNAEAQSFLEGFSVALLNWQAECKESVASFEYFQREHGQWKQQ